MRSLDTLFRPDSRRPLARMRGVLALLLVALLPAACATGPVTEAETPERAVEDSFVAFRQAVLDGDGEKAAALTTEASWDYYRDRADDALSAGPGQLQSIPLDQTLVVLTLRHALPPPALKRLSGRELLALWVDRGWIWVEEGWIDRQSLATTWPTNYRIVGAAAAARVDNELYWPPRPGITFNYERSGWRVNFLHDRRTTNPFSEALIAYFRIGSHGSIENYIYATLERVTGIKAGPDVWNPPI